MKCIHESKYQFKGFSELGYYVFVNVQATQSDEILMVESAKYIRLSGKVVYMTNLKNEKRVGFPDDLLNALRLKANGLDSNPINEEYARTDRLVINEG